VVGNAERSFVLNACEGKLSEWGKEGMLRLSVICPLLSDF
jgi:hypothetical protein